MSKNADKNKTPQKKESPSVEKTEIKKPGKSPAPVYQYDLHGNFLKKFSSRQEALNETGVTPALISLVCNGRLKSSGGYVWSNHYAPKIEVAEKLYQPVYQYDLHGNFLREFSSRQQAASVVRTSPTSILRACVGDLHTYGGYVWRNYYAEKLSIDMESGKAVYQYDLQGNFIREYSLRKDTALINGVDPSLISRVCSGRCEKYGGYIWRDIHVDKIDIDKKCRPVYQYDLDGNFVREYTSAKEAANINSTSSSVISKVCKGKKKSCGGYIWRFNYVERLDIDIKLRNPVYQYDLDGNFIKRYASSWEGARANNVDPSSIRRCCNNKSIQKTAGGYIWRDYQASHVETAGRRGKPVYQYDLDGNFIKEHASRNAAADAVGLVSSFISIACRDKNKTAGGYIWRDYRVDRVKVPVKKGNPVYQYDLDGNFIKKYASRKAAADSIGFSAPSISYACKGNPKSAGGYIWRDYRTDKIDVSGYYKATLRKSKKLTDTKE